MAIDEMNYYVEDGDWWVRLLGYRGTDQENMFNFNFDIRGPKTGLESGKTYVYSDMLRGEEPGVDDFCFAEYDAAYHHYDDADFCLTRMKDGAVGAITAHVAFGGKTYELRYGIPTMKDTIEMTFLNGHIYQYPDAGQTRYDGWDASGEYNLSVMLTSTSQDGTFGWSDINQTFTYMKRFLPAEKGEETGDVIEYVFFNASVALKSGDDGCTLEAYMSCVDGYCYHCVLACPIPKAEKKVDIVTEVLRYNASSRETEGFGYFSGFTASEYCVNLAIFPHAGKGMTGHYTETDLESMYSMVMDAYEEEKYEIFKADIDVVRDSLGGWKVDGTALCYNNTEYTFHMACAGEFEYDEEEKDLDVHFYPDEVMVMDHYLESNGVITLIPTRKNKYGALIEFRVDFEKDMREEYERTGEYRLPAGTYKIDDSGMPGTVSSSFGLVDDEPNPSYVCHLQGADQIEAPFWYIVSGEVVISYNQEKRKVEVQALNSFGRKIHMVIDDKPEAVEEVRGESEDVRKMLREGRVVIVSGESVYEVNGARE